MTPRILVDADAGLLRPAEVAWLTFFKTVIALDVLLPLSLFLGIMTGLGRLYTDSEIYAMRASGISEVSLLRPLMRLPPSRRAPTTAHTFQSHRDRHRRHLRSTSGSMPST